MDVPPVACRTNDELRVNIDVTLFYSVTDPLTAIYEQDDATYLLCETALSMVKDVVATTASTSLKGHDNGISALIVRRLNERLNDTGLKCDRVVMQEAAPRDKKVLQKQEEIPCPGPRP